MVHCSPSLIDQLSGWLRHRHAAAAPDADLLRRVAEARDEESFIALLDRHGPGVWGVCRRVAVDAHLAEDVFQATFLLLIRNAGTVRKPQALAAWLHGTAYRLAVQARRQARRRDAVERRAANSTSAPPDDLSTRELLAILDEELNRLPDAYREPLILCYLDGLTQDDAARRLRISAGSIKGRLERGRAKLADRLKRRGIRAPVLLLAPLTALAVPASLSARALELIQPGTVVSPAGAALAATAPPALMRRVGVAMIVLFLTTVVGFGFALSGAEQPIDPPLPPKPEAATKIENESLPAGAVARLGTTRLRPSGNVEYMAFSPDGKRLVSWSENHDRSYDGFIWDVASGRELKQMSVPGVKAHSCAWLPDGRGAAVVNLDWWEDTGFFLWDFATENAVPPPSGAGKGIGIRMAPAQPLDNEMDACFAVSPDGKLVAVGRSGNEKKRERRIELREFNPGRRTTELAAIRKLGNHPENCGAVYFTPDGRSLLSFNATHIDGKQTKDGKVRAEAQVVVWDVLGGTERRRLTVLAPTNQGYRPTLAVSNQYLAVGIEDAAGTLHLYDLKSGEDRSIATGHGAIGNSGGYGVSAVAFSPDGSTVFTGGRDYNVRIWDVASGKEQRKLAGHCSWVETLAVSPDGKTLASGGQDGVIHLWNVATGGAACPQPGHTGGLSGASFSRDGKSAVTSGRDGTLRLWDLATAREMQTIKVGRSVSRGELSPDGRSIIAGGFELPLKVWDATTGKETRLSAAVKALSAQFTDERTLLSFDEGVVQLQDWPALKIRRSFTLPAPEKQPGTPYCNAAALSPDGKLLVTVAHRSWYREERGMRFGYGADGVIDLWNATTGKRIRRLIKSEGVPRTALFTADGELIIQGGGQLLDVEGKLVKDLTSDLNLIDPLTSQLRRTFAPAPAKPGASLRYVLALTLSPDGRSLYVADSTGVVVVYEVATGRVRRTIDGHRSLLTGLAISRDGRRLLTASLDATALVWNLSPSAVFPRPAAPPATIEVQKLWADLAHTDPAVAFRAMAELDAAPTETIALLAKKLSPAAGSPDTAMLDKLVADLANEKFPVREKASAELDKLGESAVHGLRERLAKVTSAETRVRIIRLLDKHDPPEATPQRLQMLRALEVLEGLGTAEAKALLTKLANGAPGAQLTRDAKKSLTRLDDR